jgi:hypothetical protein
MRAAAWRSATAGLGAALVMADAAIRFPAVLDPSAPQGASALAVVALLVVMTGVVGELVWIQAGDTAPLSERLRPGAAAAAPVVRRSGRQTATPSATCLSATSNPSLR